MRLADLDHAATSGTSLLHRASPAVKLAGAAVVLAALIATDDAVVVLALVVALAAAATALGLPVARIAAAASYPVLFALVFAFSAGTGVAQGALIVGRAYGAAFVAVVLAYTTPYPQILGLVQRVLPPLVGDTLLMTYRSFFLLAEKLGRILLAIRLRSGLSGRRPVRSGRAAARSVGGLLLYSFDLARRDHDVLRLRGYERRLAFARHGSRSRVGDATVALAAGALAAFALAYRLAPGLSAAVGTWTPLAVAGSALVLAALARLASPHREEGR